MSNITLFFAGLLGVASWLMPNHYPPWVSFHADVMMAGAGLLALVAETGVNRGKFQPLPPLTQATLLLACVPLVQALGGLILFAGDGWIVFAYLLGFALAQMVGQALATRLGINGLSERLAGLFIAAAWACVALQLYQWLRLRGLGEYAIDLALGRSPYANVAQPNHLASMLFLGVVSMLFLYERRRVCGWVAGLGCVFLEFGLVMTGSRTAWLVMGLLAFASWLLRERAGLRISRAGAVAVLASFGALLAAWAPLNNLLLLSQGRTLENQAEVGPRPQIWASMLDAVSRQPWFGYGWNQGLIAHGSVVDSHPILGRLMESSHNLVLDLMIWNGVPLALALTGLLGWWFWRQWRASRSPVQVYLLIAVTAVFVHAMLEYPLNYLYFLLPVGLMMGALESTAPSRWQWRLPRWAVGALAAGAVALSVLIVCEYVEIEASTRTLRFEVARIGSGTINSKAPELTLLTQQREYLRFARVVPRPGMTPGELAWMDQVAERYPYSPSLYNVALAEALNGRPDAARATLVHLCRMHTARRCADSVQAWRRLAASEYPQLAAVTMPDLP